MMILLHLSWKVILLRTPIMFMLLLLLLLWSSSSSSSFSLFLSLSRLSAREPVVFPMGFPDKKGFQKGVELGFMKPPHLL